MHYSRHSRNLNREHFGRRFVTYTQHFGRATIFFSEQHGHGVMISISIEFSLGILQARLAFGINMSLLLRQRNHEHDGNRMGLGADEIA